MGSHTTWSGMEILDPEECWAFLSQEPVGRLAVSITDHPDIFPINHIVDRQRLLFRSAEGTKLAAAVLGRAVAARSTATTRNAGWHVARQGPGRGDRVARRSVARHGSAAVPLARGSEAPLVRITPTELTGRRFKMAEGAHVPSRHSSPPDPAAAHVGFVLLVAGAVGPVHLDEPFTGVEAAPPRSGTSRARVARPTAASCSTRMRPRPSRSTVGRRTAGR